MTVGERIRDIRKKKGLSQKELAQMIGTTQQNYQQLESGKRKPKWEQCAKIAHALGLSINYFIESPFFNTSHIEMIIDYTTDGTDYFYCDNHGILVRCRDCKHYWKEEGRCMTVITFPVKDNFYCGYGEKNETNTSNPR